MYSHEAGIVEWVNTFNLPTQCSSVKELADGAVLAQILLQISPGLFDVDDIKPDMGDNNWALKLNNLETLVFHLESFYHESLGKDADFSAPDLPAIAKDQPPEDMKTLVQLLVGAAVSCRGKASYIKAIMQMSSAGQATMQQMVQDAMAGMSGLEAGGKSGDEAELEEQWAMRLAEAEAEKTQLSTCLEELSREKEQLERSAAQLRETISDQEAMASARSAREEQAVSLNMSVDELHLALEEKEAALMSLQEEVRVLESHRGQESRSRAEAETELRQLADELDIARAKAAQAAEAEATAERYKKRIHEMSGLKAQLKELEDRISNHLNQIVELESVNKTIPTIKKNMERYKDQAMEMERQKLDATSKVAIKEAELSRLKDELEATQAKLCFKDELIALCGQQRGEGGAHQDDGGGMDTTGQGFDGEGGQSLGHLQQLQEKVARLERENSLLKAHGGAGADGRGGEDARWESHRPFDEDRGVGAPERTGVSDPAARCLASEFDFLAEEDKQTQGAALGEDAESEAEHDGGGKEEDKGEQGAAPELAANENGGFRRRRHGRLPAGGDCCGDRDGGGPQDTQAADEAIEPMVNSYWSFPLLRTPGRRRFCSVLAALLLFALGCGAYAEYRAVARDARAATAAAQEYHAAVEAADARARAADLAKAEAVERAAAAAQAKAEAVAQAAASAQEKSEAVAQAAAAAQAKSEAMAQAAAAAQAQSEAAAQAAAAAMGKAQADAWARAALAQAKTEARAKAAAECRARLAECALEGVDVTVDHETGLFVPVLRTAVFGPIRAAVAAAAWVLYPGDEDAILGVLGLPQCTSSGIRKACSSLPRAW